MDCSVAIQFLPMDAQTDEEVCRVVDAVIAYIDSTGVGYFHWPVRDRHQGRLRHHCMEMRPRTASSWVPRRAAEDGHLHEDRLPPQRRRDDHRAQVSRATTDTEFAQKAEGGRVAGVMP